MSNMRVRVTNFVVKEEEDGLFQEDSRFATGNSGDNFHCGLENCDYEGPWTELEAHLAADHMNWLPYECQMCPFVRFPTDSTLRAHTKTNHAQDGVENERKELIICVPDEEKRRELEDLLGRAFPTSPQIPTRQATTIGAAEADSRPQTEHQSRRDQNHPRRRLSGQFRQQSSTTTRNSIDGVIDNVLNGQQLNGQQLNAQQLLASVNGQPVATVRRNRKKNLPVVDLCSSRNEPTPVSPTETLGSPIVAVPASPSVPGSSLDNCGSGGASTTAPHQLSASQPTSGWSVPTSAAAVAQPDPCLVCGKVTVKKYEHVSKEHFVVSGGASGLSPILHSDEYRQIFRQCYPGAVLPGERRNKRASTLVERPTSTKPSVELHTSTVQQPASASTASVPALPPTIVTTTASTAVQSSAKRVTTTTSGVFVVPRVIGPRVVGPVYMANGPPAIRPCPATVRPIASVHRFSALGRNLAVTNYALSYAAARPEKGQYNMDLSGQDYYPVEHTVASTIHSPVSTSGRHFQSRVLCPRPSVPLAPHTGPRPSLQILSLESVDLGSVPSTSATAPNIPSSSFPPSQQVQQQQPQAASTSITPAIVTSTSNASVQPTAANNNNLSALPPVPVTVPGDFDVPTVEQHTTAPLPPSAPVVANQQSTEPSSTDLTCTLCKTTVTFATLVRHVYVKHVNEKCVSCPYCDFQLAYDVQKMRRHVQQCHKGKPVTVDDKRSAFDRVASKLIGLCFPSNGELPTGHHDYSLSTRYEDREPGHINSTATAITANRRPDGIGNEKECAVEPPRKKVAPSGENSEALEKTTAQAPSNFGAELGSSAPRSVSVLSGSGGSKKPWRPSAAQRRAAEMAAETLKRNNSDEANVLNSPSPKRNNPPVLSPMQVNDSGRTWNNEKSPRSSIPDAPDDVECIGVIPAEEFKSRHPAKTAAKAPVATCVRKRKQVLPRSPPTPLDLASSRSPSAGEGLRKIRLRKMKALRRTRLEPINIAPERPSSIRRTVYTSTADLPIVLVDDDEVDSKPPLAHRATSLMKPEKHHYENKIRRKTSAYQFGHLKVFPNVWPTKARKPVSVERIAAGVCEPLDCTDAAESKKKRMNIKRAYYSFVQPSYVPATPENASPKEASRTRDSPDILEVVTVKSKTGQVGGALSATKYVQPQHSLPSGEMRHAGIVRRGQPIPPAQASRSAISFNDPPSSPTSRHVVPEPAFRQPAPPTPASLGIAPRGHPSTPMPVRPRSQQLPERYHHQSTRIPKQRQRQQVAPQERALPTVTAHNRPDDDLHDHDHHGNISSNNHHHHQHQRHDQQRQHQQLPHSRDNHDSGGHKELQQLIQSTMPGTPIPSRQRPTPNEQQPDQYQHQATPFPTRRQRDPMVHQHDQFQPQNVLNFDDDDEDIATPIPEGRPEPRAVPVISPPMPSCPLMCTWCDEVVQPERMKEHVYREHAPRLQCKLCAFKTPMISQLRSHVDRVHPSIQHAMAIGPYVDVGKIVDACFFGRDDPSTNRLKPKRVDVAAERENVNGDSQSLQSAVVAARAERSHCNQANSGDRFKTPEAPPPLMVVTSNGTFENTSKRKRQSVSNDKSSAVHGSESSNNEEGSRSGTVEQTEKAPASEVVVVDSPCASPTLNCRRCGMDVIVSGVRSHLLSHHIPGFFKFKYRCPYCARASDNLQKVETHIVSSHDSEDGKQAVDIRDKQNQRLQSELAACFPGSALPLSPQPKFPSAEQAPGAGRSEFSTSSRTPRSTYAASRGKQKAAEPLFKCMLGCGDFPRPRIHVWVHVGRRPFECRYCRTAHHSATFLSSDKLKIHLAQKHSNMSQKKGVICRWDELKDRYFHCAQQCFPGFVDAKWTPDDELCGEKRTPMVVDLFEDDDAEEPSKQAPEAVPSQIEQSKPTTDAPSEETRKYTDGEIKQSNKNSDKFTASSVSETASAYSQSRSLAAAMGIETEKCDSLERVVTETQSSQSARESCATENGSPEPNYPSSEEVVSAVGAPWHRNAPEESAASDDSDDEFPTTGILHEPRSPSPSVKGVSSSDDTAETSARTNTNDVRTERAGPPKVAADEKAEQRNVEICDSNTADKGRSTALPTAELNKCADKLRQVPTNQTIVQPRVGAPLAMKSNSDVARKRADIPASVQPTSGDLISSAEAHRTIIRGIKTCWGVLDSESATAMASCGLCDKELKAASVVFHVYVRHIRHLPFRCAHCSQFFGVADTTRILVNHLWQAHKTSEFRIIDMRRAIRTLYREKLYKCFPDTATKLEGASEKPAALAKSGGVVRSKEVPKNAGKSTSTGSGKRTVPNSQKTLKVTSRGEPRKPASGSKQQSLLTSRSANRLGNDKVSNKRKSINDAGEAVKPKKASSVTKEFVGKQVAPKLKRSDTSARQNHAEKVPAQASLAAEGTAQVIHTGPGRFDGSAKSLWPAGRRHAPGAGDVLSSVVTSTLGDLATSDTNTEQERPLIRGEKVDVYPAANEYSASIGVDEPSASSNAGRAEQVSKEQTMSCHSSTRSSETNQQQTVSESAVTEGGTELDMGAIAEQICNDPNFAELRELLCTTDFTTAFGVTLSLGDNGFQLTTKQ